MKIVIAPDSFKGSASSSEIAQWLQSGITSVISNSDIIKVPIADGGEGSLDSVITAGFVAHTFSVTGPVVNAVEARIGIKADTELVELAEASGLSKLPMNK